MRTLVYHTIVTIKCFLMGQRESVTQLIEKVHGSHITLFCFKVVAEDCLLVIQLKFVSFPNGKWRSSTSSIPFEKLAHASYLD